jgi:hypothetical protein
MISYINQRVDKTYDEALSKAERLFTGVFKVGKY